MSYYDINEDDDNLNKSKKYYIDQYTENIIETKIEECRKEDYLIYKI